MTATLLPSRTPEPSGNRRARRWSAAGLALALGLATVGWMALTHAHPSYDAYGWMVWGHQTLAGNLSTAAAPSWKPLPYLFTLPYALLGRTQLDLWTFTASFLGLAGVIPAWRVAQRLSGSGPRRWPGWVAGATGAALLLGLYGYWRQLLITSSDPIVVGLCLAAVDAWLSRRPRLCLLALFLASLGRPEVWPFLGLVGLVELVRMRPSRLRWLILGLGGLVLAAWFVIPGLTSKSWFQSGNAALGFHTAIRHGNRITTVLDRVRSLYDSVVWSLVLAAGARALLRRDRVWLTLFAAAALWVAVEIAFAYHGWPAAPRYLMEPAALLGVLGAALLGRALSGFTGATTRPELRWWRLALLGIGVATLVAMVPFGVERVGALRYDVGRERLVSRQSDGLLALIARAGGPRALLACAPALAHVGNQSQVAWALGVNVSQVGHKYARTVAEHKPAVLIAPVTPFGGIWVIRTVDLAFSHHQAACRRLPQGAGDRLTRPDHQTGGVRRPLSAG